MFNWNEQGKFGSFDQAKDHVSDGSRKTGKKSKKEIIIGVIALLVLILALAFIVFILIR